MKRLPLWHTAVIIGYRIFFLEKKMKGYICRCGQCYNAAHTSRHRTNYTYPPPPKKKNRRKWKKRKWRLKIQTAHTQLRAKINCVRNINAWVVTSWWWIDEWKNIYSQTSARALPQTLTTYAALKRKTNAKKSLGFLFRKKKNVRLERIGNFAELHV